MPCISQKSTVRHQTENWFITLQKFVSHCFSGIVKQLATFSGPNWEKSGNLADINTSFSKSDSSVFPWYVLHLVSYNRRLKDRFREVILYIHIEASFRTYRETYKRHINCSAAYNTTFSQPFQYLTHLKMRTQGRNEPDNVSRGHSHEGIVEVK